MKKLLIIALLFVGCDIFQEEDCAGVLDGDAREDKCGVCDSDTTNDCIRDCSGVWGGDDIPIGYKAISGKCYFISDLNALDDIYRDCLGGNSGERKSTRWENGRLYYLNLKNIGLGCEIPESIGNLTELKELWLSYNQLYGEIPASFNNLTKLERLSLHDNNLSGNIENLVHLTSIKWMSISYNQFSGVIPDGINSLTMLSTILLHNNQIGGIIPDSFCEVVNDLSGEYSERNSYIDQNQFCPPYPECVNPQNIGNQNIDNCEDFECDEGNMKSGSFCYYQQDIDVLQDFISSNEGLSGKTPLEIGEQEWYGSRLTKLVLQNLELTYLPENISNLSSLEWLNLSINQLTTLPMGIGNLTNLYFLDLSTNQLNIEIPEYIINMNNLNRLLLNDNQFYGQIPEGLCYLPMAIQFFGYSNVGFNVANNNLCPPYPECFNFGEPFYDTNNNSIYDDADSLYGFIDLNNNNLYDFDYYISGQDTSECEYCIENPTDPLCN